MPVVKNLVTAMVTTEKKKNESWVKNKRGYFFLTEWLDTSSKKKGNNVTDNWLLIWKELIRLLDEKVLGQKKKDSVVVFDQEDETSGRGHP